VAARASFRHRTTITVLHDDSEINANDRDIKETFIQRHNRDEEERSQTRDVNSVTLNMLRKVNKGGGYCHKIFEFSLPPFLPPSPSLLCGDWRHPPCPNTTHPTGSKPDFGSRSTTFASRAARAGPET